MAGRLYLVGTPIGNLEDISLRALRVLREAALIAAEDTRSAGLMIEHFRQKGLWTGGAAIVSFFEGNEAMRTPRLIAALLEGGNVALISDAGMPGISDPGQRLVVAAVAAGLRVEVIPGPSAVLCALCGSGLSTDCFLFLGFPPRQEGPRQALFGSLRGEIGTLVLLESPERTGRTLWDLEQALGGDRPACVARELTKIHEEYVRAPLAELARRYAETPPRGEVTLVVSGWAGAQGPEVVDIEGEIRRRVQAGQTAREIAAALALQTGKPRRQLYQLVLLHKEE